MFYVLHDSYARKLSKYTLTDFYQSIFYVSDRLFYACFTKGFKKRTESECN